MGGGGSSPSAAAPAPQAPAGKPRADQNGHKAVKQNRTEGSPLGRPLLTPEQAKPQGLLG